MGLSSPVGLVAAALAGYLLGRRDAAWRAFVAEQIERAHRGSESERPPASDSKLAYALADERETEHRHRAAERLRSEPLRGPQKPVREDDDDLSTLVGNFPRPERDEGVYLRGV